MTESNEPERPGAESDDEYAETQVLGDGQGVRPDAGKAGADPDGGQPTELRQALEQARAQADEHREQMLRTAAELENLRKRSAREMENARKFGTERLVGELLVVIDSLEMGLQAAQAEGGGSALIEGQQATLKLLLNVLEKYGVQAIDPQGERFDPQFHEAISVVPGTGAEPDSIITVVQKGYLLHERLLRPARVIVATEAPRADGS